MAAPSGNTSLLKSSKETTDMTTSVNILYVALESRLTEFLQKSNDNEILLRCKCHQLELQNTLSVTENDEKQKVAWMKLYVQAVMDLTFYEENELVEQDFPEPNGGAKVFQIIEDLLKVEPLCKQIVPNKQLVTEVLSDEVVECLRWRCGALLYMYCATLEQQPSRRDQNRQHFCQCSQEGVLHLQSMLNVRTPLGHCTDGMQTNNQDMVTLLQNGVFSDTHMLALMYCGELCFWWLQNSDASNHSQFPANDIGTSCLQRYLDMVKGPLKCHGWASDRAEELLTNLQKKS